MPGFKRPWKSKGHLFAVPGQWPAPILEGWLGPAHKVVSDMLPKFQSVCLTNGTTWGRGVRGSSFVIGFAAGLGITIQSIFALQEMLVSSNGFKRWKTCKSFFMGRGVTGGRTQRKNSTLVGRNDLLGREWTLSAQGRQGRGARSDPLATELDGRCLHGENTRCLLGTQSCYYISCIQRNWVICIFPVCIYYVKIWNPIPRILEINHLPKIVMVNFSVV